MYNTLQAVPVVCHKSFSGSLRDCHIPFRPAFQSYPQPFQYLSKDSDRLLNFQALNGRLKYSLLSYPLRISLEQSHLLRQAHHKACLMIPDLCFSNPQAAVHKNRTFSVLTC